MAVCLDNEVACYYGYCYICLGGEWVQYFDEFGYAVTCDRPPCTPQCEPNATKCLSNQCYQCNNGAWTPQFTGDGSPIPCTQPPCTPQCSGIETQCLSNQCYQCSNGALIPVWDDFGYAVPCTQPPCTPQCYGSETQCINTHCYQCENGALVQQFTGDGSPIPCNQPPCTPQCTENETQCLSNQCYRCINGALVPQFTPDGSPIPCNQGPCSTEQKCTAHGYTFTTGSFYCETDCYRRTCQSNGTWLKGEACYGDFCEAPEHHTILTVNSEPSGAYVTAGARSIGVTPIQNVQVDCGYETSIQVGVTKSGCTVPPDNIVPCDDKLHTMDFELVNCGGNNLLLYGALAAVAVVGIAAFVYNSKKQ